MPDDRLPPSIYVLSDATGNSAEQMVFSALIQFEGPNAPVRVWPRVRSNEDIDRIVEAAQGAQALLIHTLVTPEHVEHLEARARELRLDCVDLIGPLLTKLTHYLHRAPKGRPGRHATLDDEYFRRVEALEFTVNADDGRGVDQLHEADIVLVGPSRSSKTPVATYLAGKGYKVANVPLIRNVAPPEELRDLPRGKVFALTIDPQKLADIRASRMSQLGVGVSGDYADFDHVVEELHWVDDLFRRERWPVINVTQLAVEETASKVLRLHHRFRGDPRDGTKD